MFKVLFVCHGNICRSPMAEFLMINYVKNQGRENEFYISSCATSTEEIGNPVYPPVKRILDNLNIDCSKKQARQFKKEDYNNYDLIICMDHNNFYNLLRMIKDDPKDKIKLLMSFTGSDKDVSDPWYTRDFMQAYNDINSGVKALYNYLISK